MTDKNCKTCDSNNKCSACVNDYELNTTTGVCKEKNCTVLVTNCSTCDVNNKCATCSTNFTLLEENGKKIC